MQAVILAGGLGTRLGDLTRETPKPLISAAGAPLLDHLIWNLGRFGIRDIVLATSYLSDRIAAYVADRPAGGPRIRIGVEDSPLGTGGGLRNCLELLDERFFVLNGDTLFDVNYLALVQAHAATAGVRGAVAVRAVDDVARYGRVLCDGALITNFAEKSGGGPGAINGGIYYLERDVIAALPPAKSISLEAEVLPALVVERQLAGVALDGYFIDIGLPETLRKADRDLASWRRRPIAFLDRDGVINEDCGYLHRAEDCRWVGGAAAAIRRLNEAGFLVIVVTNQAGIGRGHYTEHVFANFMDWYRGELARQGAHFDDLFFSPYHPTAAIGDYRRDSDWRKPNPGMLLEAFARWPHDKTRSFLIGDKDSDLEAAHSAGIPGHRFEGGDLDAFVRAISGVDVAVDARVR